MINIYTLSLICVLSLLGAILFGGIGTAFLSTDRINTKGRDHGSGIYSLIIPFLLARPAFFMIPVLFTYLGLLVSFLISFFLISFPVLTKLFISPSAVIVLFVQVILSMLIIIPLVFLPRLTFFRIHSSFALKIFSIPAFLIIILLSPLTLLILIILKLLGLVFLRNKPVKSGEGFFYRYNFPEFFSPFTIEETIKEKTDEKEPEIRIFQNALEFSRLKVRDCMIPRNEITALEVSSSLDELRDKFVESGYSKILIFEETIDNIIGYVNSKVLFSKPAGIRQVLASLSLVPESMQINKLFHTLIRERRSIALVVDEYGGTSGIITLEDIMEEIFGEIEDEHDTQEFIERQVNETEFILSGRLEIDYLNEKYNIGIPETEDYDTLAGFIIFHHENIPKLNTRIIVGDLHFRVLKVSATRVELVSLRIERDSS
jgi:CBS domain containing-hemolysin-like protein